MRLLADENISRALVSGLKRRLPGLDIVRVQDVGLLTQDDPTILEWAAQNGRIVISFDKRTLSDFAYARVEKGQSMPGVVLMASWTPIGDLLDALELFIECSLPDEHTNTVVHLPFSPALTPQP